ncbi:uncharacterized protein LOC125942863 [Dermacentor silvarum]|uniref:uncharacterized protein LOC125942863 n=1 Tax=Dermacentor silvarum TaxID=543639 RepID=UPI002100DB27|nr:uncharacterized protein LOC125942863 [Dermacentor silvarum]
MCGCNWQARETCANNVGVCLLLTAAAYLESSCNSSDSPNKLCSEAAISYRSCPQVCSQDVAPCNNHTLLADTESLASSPDSPDFLDEEMLEHAAHTSTIPASCSVFMPSCPSQALSNGMSGSLPVRVPPEGQYLSPDAVTALHKTIRQLENQLRSTKRSLALTQRMKNKAVKEKIILKKQSSQFVACDQLQCMEKSSTRGTRWSPTTIQKALKVRLSCGARGYSVVKELCTPLPSERTLQRHLEKNKFSPGILHDILQCLALKVKLMDDHERHAVIMLDEIQLAPGLALDQSTGIVIGRPTYH